MIKLKEKGRPPEIDRDKIKSERFQFAFSKNDISRFGNRKTLLAAVRDYVENFNTKKPKK